MRREEIQLQRVLFGTVAAAAMNAFGRKQQLSWKNFFDAPGEEGRRVLSIDEMRDQFRLAHSLIGTN